MDIFRFTIVASILAIFATVIYVGFKELPESSKSDFVVKNTKWSRSVEVVIDPDTGCEYLLTSRGGITSRKGVNLVNNQCR